MAITTEASSSFDDYLRAQKRKRPEQPKPQAFNETTYHLADDMEVGEPSHNRVTADQESHHMSTNSNGSHTSTPKSSADNVTNQETLLTSVIQPDQGDTNYLQEEEIQDEDDV